MQRSIYSWHLILLLIIAFTRSNRYFRMRSRCLLSGYSFHSSETENGTELSKKLLFSQQFEYSDVKGLGSKRKKSYRQKILNYVQRKKDHTESLIIIYICNRIWNKIHMSVSIDLIFDFNPNK